MLGWMIVILFLGPILIFTLFIDLLLLIIDISINITIQFITKGTGKWIHLGAGNITLGFVNLFSSKKSNDLANLDDKNIAEVDKMEGLEFEHYLAKLFANLGYDTKVTNGSGDYGADLILLSNTKKIIVQAKRYKKRVGIKAVQEIASAKSHYNADECWVITNNFFTDPAKKLAKSNHVTLIDRTQLMNWMLEMKKEA